MLWLEFAVSDLDSRHTVAINNTCDLVIGGEQGESVIVSARSRNQFFDKRELLLGHSVGVYYKLYRLYSC